MLGGLWYFIVSCSCAHKNPVSLPEHAIRAHTAVPFPRRRAQRRCCQRTVVHAHPKGHVPRFGMRNGCLVRPEGACCAASPLTRRVNMANVCSAAVPVAAHDTHAPATRLRGCYASIFAASVHCLSRALRAARSTAAAGVCGRAHTGVSVPSNRSSTVGPRPRRATGPVGSRRSTDTSLHDNCAGSAAAIPEGRR